MNFLQFVNKLARGARHWLSIFMLCLLFSSTALVANTTVVKLSLVTVEGSSMKDGNLIGRGRVICDEAHSGFQLWMAPEFLAPSKNGYVLSLAENPQAKLHIRLQGYGWNSVTPLDPSISKIGSESSAEFDIVSNGDQLLFSGFYSLRLSAACI